MRIAARRGCQCQCRGCIALRSCLWFLLKCGLARPRSSTPAAMCIWHTSLGRVDAALKIRIASPSDSLIRTLLTVPVSSELRRARRPAASSRLRPAVTCPSRPVAPSSKNRPLGPPTSPVLVLKFTDTFECFRAVPAGLSGYPSNLCQRASPSADASARWPLPVRAGSTHRPEPQ